MSKPGDRVEHVFRSMADGRDTRCGAWLIAHRQLHRASVVADVDQLPGHRAVDVSDLGRVIQLRNEKQPLLLQYQ